MGAQASRRRSGGALHDGQVYPQGQQLPPDVQALLNSPCPTNCSAVRLIERAHRLAD
jgi:hypothetical protein